MSSQQQSPTIAIFNPRPSTSLKSGSLFLVMVSVHPYKTKQTDQRVKPLFKLVLWLVLGRGSLYDSGLVSFNLRNINKVMLFGVS